ncbi:hypothetical protein ACFXQA_10015 [Microbacterium sp. P07]|uniref:hypothetical protein n=1 Tax=Microbacterium sp. P07 TaxID=3366952 RepID=UPI0037472ED5
MGDHREILVDLGTSPSSAGHVADETRRWLIASGWADPASPAEDWLYPEVAGYTLGSHARGLFPSMREGTLAVVQKRDAYGVGDGTTDPACPKCSSSAPSDDAEAAFLSWWEGLEPTLRCQRCAFSGPIGDWDLSDSVAVGEIAVVIDPDAGTVDPAAVAEALLSELRAQSGRRWTYTHLHL